MIKLTQDELKSQLSYEPLTGDFTWLVSNSPRVKIGDIAGTKRADGYIYIAINNERHLSHRLAWFYTYGYFPENDLDHINRIKDDNRVLNLREVSRQCNVRNCNISINNTSGITGVSWHQCNRKWRSRITVNNKLIHLGIFDSITDAAKARLEAEVKYGFPNCNTTSSAYQYLNNIHNYISVPPKQNIEYDTSKAVQDIPNIVA